METFDRGQLLSVLEQRFTKNSFLHPQISWADVLTRLESNEAALKAIGVMETTDGEPDLIVFEGEWLYVDCSAESPKARRSLCYDEEAWLSRKEHKPKISAMAMAKEMKVSILDEAEYYYLQSLKPLDLKTSSWLLSPPPFRALGGALFGDRRFDRVFTYHNGAESYYSSRGFRAKVKV